MSRHPNNVPTPPKTERWLIIMALAFVPVVLALFLPQATRIPLLVVSAVTFLVSFVLMVRHSKTNGGTENLRRLVHSEQAD